jgi:hypothetical protein
VVQAPGHDLNAGVVEDDHSIHGRSFLVEVEEVAKPQFMCNGKGCSPIIDNDHPAIEIGGHPPATPGVGEDCDLF